jgi:hypothetical protein
MARRRGTPELPDRGQTARCAACALESQRQTGAPRPFQRRSNGRLNPRRLGALPLPASPLSERQSPRGVRSMARPDGHRPARQTSRPIPHSGVDAYARRPREGDVGDAVLAPCCESSTPGFQKGGNPGAWTCVVMEDAAELFGTRGLVKIRWAAPAPQRSSARSRQTACDALYTCAPVPRRCLGERTASAHPAAPAARQAGAA